MGPRPAAERPALEPEAGRVTTLELFFDLVFVFTLTQLAGVLEDGELGPGVLDTGLLLGLVFFMYGGFAWLTNAVVLETPSRRVLLLVGMGAFLILALSIPRAYDGDGALFGGVYVGIVLLHLGLYRGARTARSRQGIRAIAPSNLTGAALVLAGGIAGGLAQHLLWGAAIVVLWLVPLARAVGSFDLAPEHFVERHGLVVLVAIGESVVAIGIGARGLPVDLGLVGTALLALGLNALLWWTYFGGDDTRAAQSLTDTPPERRGRAALLAFGHCHLALLGGIIGLAAGLAEAVAHPGEALPTAAAVELAGGAALFLLGDAGMRQALRLGTPRWRAAGAVAVLATIPIGLGLTAWSMLLALFALYAGALILEHRTGSGSRLRVRA